MTISFVSYIAAPKPLAKENHEQFLWKIFIFQGKIFPFEIYDIHVLYIKFTNEFTYEFTYENVQMINSSVTICKLHLTPFPKSVQSICE